MVITPPRFKPSPGKKLIFVSALVLGLSAAGCTIERQPRGFVIDPQIADGMLPGLDNMTSVQDSMGSPSIVGTFEPDVWYYISEITRRRSFFKPKAIERTILAVQFDEDGVVDDIRRYTLADARKIDPQKDTTPTRGKKLGVFEQIFSNIGRFSTTPGQ